MLRAVATIRSCNERVRSGAPFLGNQHAWYPDVYFHLGSPRLEKSALAMVLNAMGITLASFLCVIFSAFIIFFLVVT
jgi:hypothetical protein